MAVLSIGLMRYASNTSDNLELRNEAQHLTIIARAAAKYIGDNRDSLVKECSGSGCSRNLDDLKNGGFLSKEVSNKFGGKNQQDMQLLIRIIPEPNRKKVQALLISYGGHPYSDDELGRIAANAGAFSGFVSRRKPTEIYGVNGNWSSEVSDWNGFSNKPTHGYIAALVSSDLLNDGGGIIRKGMIVMWSARQAGDKIPDGWLLCDGQNGTPNLLDRFILASTVGKEGEQNNKDWRGMKEMPTDTAVVKGIVRISPIKLTRDQMPDTPLLIQGIERSYSHGGSTFNSGAYVDDYADTLVASFGGDQEIDYKPIVFSGNGHRHIIDARPPYYRLAYIMKK